jgi:hypothetical protein
MMSLSRTVSLEALVDHCLLLMEFNLVETIDLFVDHISTVVIDDLTRTRSPF